MNLKTSSPDLIQILIAGAIISTGFCSSYAAARVTPDDVGASFLPLSAEHKLMNEVIELGSHKKQGFNVNLMTNYSDIFCYHVYGFDMPITQIPEPFKKLIQGGADDNTLQAAITALEGWNHKYHLNLTHGDYGRVAGIDINSALLLIQNHVVDQIQDHPEDKELLDSINSIITHIITEMQQDVGNLNDAEGNGTNNSDQSCLQEKYDKADKKQRDMFAALVAIMTARNQSYTLEQMVQMVGALIRLALADSHSLMIKQFEKYLEFENENHLFRTFIVANDPVLIALTRIRKLEKLRSDLNNKVQKRKSKESKEIRLNGNMDAAPDNYFSAINLGFPFNFSLWAQQVEIQELLSQTIQDLVNNYQLTPALFIYTRELTNAITQLNSFAQGNSVNSIPSLKKILSNVKKIHGKKIDLEQITRDFFDKNSDKNPDKHSASASAQSDETDKKEANKLFVKEVVTVLNQISYSLNIPNLDLKPLHNGLADILKTILETAELNSDMRQFMNQDILGTWRLK